MDTKGGQEVLVELRLQTLLGGLHSLQVSLELGQGSLFRLLGSLEVLLLFLHQTNVGLDFFKQISGAE